MKPVPDWIGSDNSIVILDGIFVKIEFGNGLDDTKLACAIVGVGVTNNKNTRIIKKGNNTFIFFKGIRFFYFFKSKK